MLLMYFCILKTCAQYIISNSNTCMYIKYVYIWGRLLTSHLYLKENKILICLHELLSHCLDVWKDGHLLLLFMLNFFKEWHFLGHVWFKVDLTKLIIAMVKWPSHERLLVMSLVILNIYMLWFSLHIWILQANVNIFSLESILLEERQLCQ